MHIKENPLGQIRGKELVFFFKSRHNERNAYKSTIHAASANQAASSLDLVRPVG
jgi:hypothetical protein